MCLCTLCGAESLRAKSHLIASTPLYCKLCHIPERLRGVDSPLASHAGSYSYTYTKWKQMWARCRRYPNYATRTPQGAWSKYENFLEDMGECPDGMTLERRDNNKGYTSDNCYWAPYSRQLTNTGRNLYVHLNGRYVTFTFACEYLGLSAGSVYRRLSKGVGIKEAFLGRLDSDRFFKGTEALQVGLSESEYQLFINNYTDS